jgi:uncharacterized protein
MKLHQSDNQKYQTISGYFPGGVEINGRPFDYSLLVLPETAPRAWPVTRFEDLTVEHFEQLAAEQPDVVILGTGERQRFAHPKLTTPLTSKQVGVECMDTNAACRTYNILMGEGRKALLALIIEKP